MMARYRSLSRSGARWRRLALPRIANYAEAEDIIVCWQEQFAPNSTVILLDQPIIVANLEGQRPVEGIISSPVSARLGGMQPASISREEMFGAEAPVWQFLQRFGGPPIRIRPPAVHLFSKPIPF
jgi:predicted RNase H-like nuclease